MRVSVHVTCKTLSYDQYMLALRRSCWKKGFLRLLFVCKHMFCSCWHWRCFSHRQFNVFADLDESW